MHLSLKAIKPATEQTEKQASDKLVRIIVIRHIKITASRHVRLTFSYCSFLTTYLLAVMIDNVNICTQ